MEDDDVPPLYRFRWDNMTLEAFIEGRFNAALAYRNQSAALLLKAETIESEIREWRAALVEQGMGE